MGILVFSGMECGGTPIDTGAGEWDNGQNAFTGGSVAYQSTIRRSGYYALRCQATSSTNSNIKAEIFPSQTTSPQAAYVTIWLRIAALPVTNSVTILGFSGNGTHTVRVNLRTDGKLDFEWGAGNTWNAIGTSINAPSLDTWHRFDIRSTGHDTGSLTAELKVDGVSEVSTSGVGISTGTLLVFFIGGNVLDVHTDTWDFYADDFIWRDDAYHTDDGGCVNLIPDGNGTYTAWTGTFADVDDIPVDTSNFVSSSSTTAAETSALQSCATAGVDGSIIAVANWILMGKAVGAGAVTVSMRLRSGTVDTDTAYANTISSSVFRWNAVSPVLTTDPNTGIAWTTAGLDAAEVGVVSTGANATERRAYAYGLLVWTTAPRLLNILPIVSSISPSSGPKAGGTAVTVTGSGFTGATSCKIGGVALTSFTVVSDTSITGTTASISKAGLYNVEVAGTNGVGVLTSGYTYLPGNSNGQSGNNTTGGTSIIVNVPTNASGDVMLAFITVRGTTNTVTQATWGAAIDIRSDGTNARTHTFKKNSNGSEPSTYTFTIGTSAKASGVIIAQGDVDNTSAAYQVSSQANASSANIVAPSLTPRRLGSVSIMGAGTSTGTTVTPSSSPAYTEPANADNASTGAGAGTRTTTEGSYRQLTSLSATGTITAVAGAAALNTGTHVMLDPPGVIELPLIDNSGIVYAPTLSGSAPPFIPRGRPPYAQALAH